MYRFFILGLALVMIGCVTSPSGDKEPCRPSCVIDRKEIYKVPLPPEEAHLYVHAIGDTLYVYIGYLEGGKSVYFDKKVYDSLRVGDTLSNCTIDPLETCQYE